MGDVALDGASSGIAATLAHLPDQHDSLKKKEEKTGRHKPDTA
jgi:hypothetical protein